MINPFGYSVVNASQWRYSTDANTLHYYAGAFAQPGLIFKDAIQPDFWSQSYGAYAHVVIDKQSGNFALIRDHFGCAPLYYYWDRQQFVFASNLPDLLAYLPGPIQIDQEILCGFAARSQIYNNRTIYQNIYRAEPGHIMVFKRNGKVDKKLFWGLNLHARDIVYPHEQDYLERFADLMHESIRFHTRGVAHLGAELSGGLDSSAILATAHQQGLRYPLFMHIAPADGIEVDDRHLAEQTLRHLHWSDVEYINADAFDPVATMQFCAKIFAGPAPYLFFTLAHNIHQAAVARGCTVLLSGAGGDECVSGHGLIWPGLWGRLMPRGASIRKREWHHLQGPRAHEMYMRVEYSAVIAQAMGFEYRYPLLYPPLVEFCFGLPALQKRQNGLGRYLIRQYLADLVPPSVYLKNQKIGGILPATMQKCYDDLAAGKFDPYFADLPLAKRLPCCTPHSQLKNLLTAYMLKYYQEYHHCNSLDKILE